jgi:hypothetical protein
MNPRLDVPKIVAGAFVIPWWHRRSFTKVLAVPSILLVAVSVSAQVASEERYADVPYLLAALGLLLIAALVGTWCTVHCHRLVLLGPEHALSEGSRHRWTRRETRFLLKAAAIWFMVILLAALFYGPSLHWLGSVNMTTQAIWRYLCFVPGYLLLARLALVLPATAVDRKVDLQWAWRLSKGNTLRLLVVVGVFPSLLDLVALTYREDPTLVERLLFGVIGCVVLAIEITALSLSYRELTRNERLDD